MAYFLMFTTYGTHLPGDSRGSLDRNAGRLEDRPALVTYSKNVMPETAFRLSGAEDRKIVLDAILAVCRYRQWRLIALHVRTEHVHGLVQAEGVTARRVMGDWKSYATRGLRQRWPERRQFWTRVGNCRRVNDRGFDDIVHYVLEEQGEPLATYLVPPR